jgi:EAL domain-containing protein (putative c-di-GMP-specific phosphodiesterase class I)
VLRAAEPVLDGLTARVADGIIASLLERHATRARLEPMGMPRVEESRAAVAGHLRAVLSADADADAVAEGGRRAAVVHAMAGVELEWYAEAAARAQRIALQDLGLHPGVPDVAEVARVVGERLAADLQAGLAGYHAVLAGVAAASQAIGAATMRAATVTDLLRAVLGELAGLDGAAAALFGRPDPTGALQFEAGTGAGAEALMAAAAERGARRVNTGGDDATGLGPSGRAWRTGRVQFSDDYLHDPTTAPWHEIGRRSGWGASAALPVGGPGEPVAMLNVYAAHPGWFGLEARRRLLAHTLQMLEPALVRLHEADRLSAAVRPYATRSQSLASLADGAVRMRFQPIVSLPDGAVRRFEALARLVGPGGELSPAQFLPALGDGELVRLFEIGLDASLGALRDWEARGLHTDVSLNLPGVCLADASHVPAVEAALARHGVAPERLTLEVLETGERGLGDACLDALRRLAALGVRLAEDDLGTGHSSLLRLQQVAFDEVKIDQQLVRDAENHPRERLTFIQPLADLAHGLGMRVTVEGLETAGLLEAAAMLGADEGQGYVIGRPMTAEEVPGWAAAARVEVDPRVPRTHLGALAAHIAWEHRLAVTRTSPLLRNFAADDGCRMEAYIRRADPDPALLDAHLALHAVAVAEGGAGPAYERAWETLQSRLGLGPGTAGATP